MDSRTFPPRSTHTRWYCGVPEPVRYINVPVSYAEKLASGVLNANCSAIGTASPVCYTFFGSDGCARRVPWHTNRRCLDDAYTAAESEFVNCLVSGESCAP